MCSASRAAALALAWFACLGCDQKSPAAPGSPPVEAAVGPVSSAAVGPLPGPHDTQTIENPYAHDAAALTEGRVLFGRYNCDGCHGGHAGGGMGPSLRDDAWLYGKSDEDLFKSIAQGRGHGMPAWGVKLPTDHVWKLVAYLKSLRTRDEPEPPSPPPHPWEMP